MAILSFDQSNRLPEFLNFRLTKIDCLTLKMGFAQVVETSVAINSPSQDSSHPADLFQQGILCPLVLKLFSTLLEGNDIVN